MNVGTRVGDSNLRKPWEYVGVTGGNGNVRAGDSENKCESRRRNNMIGFYNYTVIPTYIGLASSVLGIFIAIQGEHPFLSIVCLLFSGLCDMYDGKIARTRSSTNQEKRFGIQIDSLSDLVCFGVLPVIIAYSIGLRYWYYILIYVFYVLMAVIRLGYFNVLEEERQKETAETRKHFTGVPVTSAALIFPLVFGLKVLIEEFMPYLFVFALVVTGVLFVVNIKVKKPQGRGMYVVLGVGILAFILLVLCTVL